MKEPFELVRRYFLEARDQPLDRRNNWLSENCAEADVRAEVLDLLRHDVEDPFLESPIVAAQPERTEHAPTTNAAALHPAPPAIPAERQRTVIFELEAPNAQSFADKYKLLQVIGQGGFGVVFMADQLVPVRRRVAIKMLRDNLDSKSILARFESERQALAMMDHPNISRVFDGGVTDNGTPYFVMELVNGIPITDFCDSQKLSNSDRMLLLRDVCNAVHHAHQKGIIHRDLKPSNILVSQIDGKPTPKVIDFGIAKAQHGALTEQTLFTAFQQMIGTPEYMSPEQAETSINDIDTRTDVFSLGVLAYELLTGTTPFDGRTLRKLSFAEIQRTIREVEPPKPSDRLSTLGDQVAMLAAKRAASQSNLSKSLRGDLDWIVMKAMDKDRSRRYGSAQAMAEDIERWLQQEPILARPPSLAYRTQKWTRKHRTAVGFTCIIGLGIVLSAIGLGYGLSERNAAQERLRQVAERAAELQKVADMEALQSKSLRYANSMLAANEAFDRGRRETNLQLLANCPEDQRGIEWQWMNHLAADQTQPLMVSSKEHSLTALAYGPDGRWIISAGVDGTLRQFNPDSRRELRSWLASDSAIRCISIDPDGSFVACGNESGQLSLWNLETAQRLAIHQFPSSITVCAIDIETPTGAGERRFSISAGCQNGHVYVWKLNVANPTEQPPNSIFKLSGQIHSLQYSKDKKRLLAAGKGGVVLLNLEQSGQSLSTGQFWQSYKALFSTDDTVVFFGPPELVAYSLTNESETIFEVPSAGISAATYVAKDHSIILATDDQALRRISLQNGDQETIGYCHAGAIQQLATYGSGDQIAMVLSDGSLRTLNRDSFAAPYTIRAFDHELSQLTAESLESVYALSERGELVAWNALTGVETFRRKIHELQGFSISLRAAQRELITLGLDQRMVFQSTQPSPRVKRSMLL